MKTIVLAIRMLADTNTAIGTLAPTLRGWEATRDMETIVLLIVVVVFH